MNLEEAKAYIRFGIKEGIYESEYFENMTDYELMIFASNESNRAEWQYESARDEGLI